jgi:hypothetical protein
MNAGWWTGDDDRNTLGRNRAEDEDRPAPARCACGARATRSGIRQNLTSWVSCDECDAAGRVRREPAE